MNAEKMTTQESLGAMIFLMSKSDYHQDWPLHYINEDLLPAVHYKQFKIYFGESGEPNGFVTWAWINDDFKNKLTSDGNAITGEQWNSGENLYIADFVAPFGNAREMIRDLRNNEFSSEKAFGLRRSKDGHVKKICYWRGCKAHK